MAKYEWGITRVDNVVYQELEDVASKDNNYCCEKYVNFRNPIPAIFVANFLNI